MDNTKHNKRSGRGRPKKKPGYNREAHIEKLIGSAVALFGEPFDDRDARSEDAHSIEVVAKAMCITPVKVRKLLITADYFTTEISREIQRLHKLGKTVNEIMAKTGLKQASVYSYLPYKKGAYNLQEPTLYAEQTRLFRRRKKVCESLAEHMGFNDAEEYLWDAILAFESYPFRDENGIRFRYAVSCETILFSGKTIERTEILKVFHIIQKIKNAKGKVSKAEFEKYCDKPELYVVFTRLGVC